MSSSTKQQVNKAEWYEYQKVCRNCVLWQSEGNDTPMGVCTLTDTLKHEMQQSCSDLRFTVYDTEQR